MELGIITRHLPRPSVEALAAAVAGYGLTAVQLNLDSAGLEAFPERFDPAVARRIRAAFADHGVAVAAVHGTFNMIDPLEERKREHIARFPVLLEWCRALDCDIVTGCTGTRSAAGMWRRHPDNARPDAWQDLLYTLQELLPHAERADVTLAVEPEVVNVVDTAEKAQRLIEEVGSPWLRLVMDPANYFHPDMLPRMDAVLDEVFERVGNYVVLAHAKDVRGPDPGGDECIRPAAGAGVLDYARYLALLEQHGYDGALIMHSLDEREVPASAAYIRRFLAAARA